MSIGEGERRETGWVGCPSVIRRGLGGFNADSDLSALNPFRSDDKRSAQLIPINGLSLMLKPPVEESVLNKA